jgi:non-ribosomal peptide synthetase component F
MEKRPLTKFPPLFLKHKAADQNTYSASENIFKALPREILILAWASVLRGYTGYEDVVFAYNNDAVHVNTATWNLQTLEHCERDLSYSTAILVDDFGIAKPSANGKSTSRDRATSSSLSSEQSGTSMIEPRMLVSYNSSSGHLMIRTQAIIPEAYLPEVLRQFAHAVTWACRETRHQVPESSAVKARLSVINEHPKLLKGPQLLHDLIASRHESDAIAVEYLALDDERHSLSYRELWKQAQALSRRLVVLLKDQGVSQNSRIIIPVLVPQSLELYVALLAILHTGAAFCPLTADMPAGRVKFIANDVQAKVLVTTSALNSSIPQEAGFVLCIVDNLEEESIPAAPSVFRDASPADTAYVMYSK